MPWQNLNAGNFDSDTAGQTNSFWLPEMFSKKVQIAFRKSAITQAITNTDYFGEITQFGDTVNIIKEPQITVSAYTRGAASVTESSLSDEELVLKINFANSFQFYVDDLEKKFSHVNWQEVASNNAGYQLKDSMDSEILTGIEAGTEGAPAAANIIGSDAVGTIPAATFATLTGGAGGTGGVEVGFDADDVEPADLLGRAARLLDQQNVPSEDRWVVAGPEFFEEMAKSDSKLMSTDFNAGLGDLRNGLVQEGKVRGFTMYVTNNMPATTNNSGVLYFGQRSAIASAEALTTMEALRSTASFRDIVRGLHVYGYKILRPEAVGMAYYALGVA